MSLADRVLSEVTEDLPGWENSALNAELAALKAQRWSPVRTSLADTVLDSADDIEVDAGLMAELEALRLRRAEVERPPEPLVEPLPTREAPLAIPRADDELKVIAQELGLQTAEQIAEAEVDPALEELRKKRGKKEPEDHAVAGEKEILARAADVGGRTEEQMAELAALREEYTTMFGQEDPLPVPAAPTDLPSDPADIALREELASLKTEIASLDVRSSTVATKLGARVSDVAPEALALQRQNAHVRALLAPQPPPAAKAESRGWVVAVQGSGNVRVSLSSGEGMLGLAVYGSGEWTVTAGSSRSALAQAPLQSETLVLGVTPDGEQGFLLRNDTQVWSGPVVPPLAAPTVELTVPEGATAVRLY